MVKFGVWVVDLMLQYAVGILNTAGHDRGGVVWLEFTLELGLVGFVWPFSVFYVAFFSHLRDCRRYSWWPRVSRKGYPRQWEAPPGGHAGFSPPQNAGLMPG